VSGALATTLKLTAERRAGELLAGMEMHGGDRKSSYPRDSLKDLGISQLQSSRWQRAALVPEPPTTGCSPPLPTVCICTMSCIIPGVRDRGKRLASPPADEADHGTFRI